MENLESDRPLEDVEAVEAVEATPLLGDRSSRGFQSLFTHHIPVASLLLYVCLFLVMELGNSLPANSLVQVVEEALCQEVRGTLDCGADDDVQSSLAILMGWYHTVMILPGLSTISPLQQFFFKSSIYVTNLLTITEGLLTVLPYGMLADRYGQRPFLVMSTFGIALTGACVRIMCKTNNFRELQCTNHFLTKGKGFWPEKFSIHALWATQLLYFIGGGLPASNAILFANITGLTTDVSRFVHFNVSYLH